MSTKLAPPLKPDNCVRIWRRHHGLVLRRDSEAGIAVREHMDEMWRQAPDLTVAHGLASSHSTAAMLAAVIWANGQSRAATRTELRASQLRAICRRIDKQIADPGLGPTPLARDFYVTRPTLYRMFEPHGGIGKYILGRRLTGVFRDLSDPSLAHRKVAEILRQRGFTNHTAAGRAFRRAYGMTPSECRSQAREMRRAGGVAGAKAFDVPLEMPTNITAFQRHAAQGDGGVEINCAMIENFAGHSGGSIARRRCADPECARSSVT